jgi:hypothetical protein|nr:MAG TPA: hypothetical protein [Caudoviricetes sp.]DAO57564.1 MAG TPA: hypothetical protein [Caudoviricetes sp.]
MGKGSSRDQARYDSIASNLEVFVDDISTLFIFEGQKEKDIEEATKVLKKAIKHLKNGKPEKVLNMEKFEEYVDMYAR